MTETIHRRKRVARSRSGEKHLKKPQQYYEILIHADGTYLFINGWRCMGCIRLESVTKGLCAKALTEMREMMMEDKNQMSGTGG